MLPISVYRTMLASLSDGLYYVNRDREIQFWNRAAEIITGYKGEEVLGSRCQDNLLRHEDSFGCLLCKEGCPLHQTLTDGQYREVEVFLRHKSGYKVPVFARITPVILDGAIVGAMEVFNDNSYRLHRENVVGILTKLVMQDPLTGLSNHKHTREYLAERILDQQRFGLMYTVLYVDLNNFRSINDTYGHDVGDGVIKAISLNFQNNLRQTDLIGRWGGEEFVGVFEIAELEDIYPIAQKIHNLVAQAHVVEDGQPVVVSASIGATYIKLGDSVDGIISRANALMHQAKQDSERLICLDGDIPDTADG